MEQLTQDVFLTRLKQATTRYNTLLQQSRTTYGDKASIETDALRELAAALEELNVTAEELQAQNDALRDAYQEIEKERTHYAELFGLVPDAYIVTDSFATVIEANQAAESMLQMPGDRMRGKPLAVFISEQDRKAFRDGLREIHQTDTRLEWTAMITPRSGTPFRATVRVGRIHDGTKHQRLGWMIRDTTEKQRVATLGQRFAEEQSARIEAERVARRFRVLAEASKQLTAETDVSAMCHGVAKAIVKFAADYCEILTAESGELKTQARVTREPRQAAFVDALRKRHNLVIGAPDNLIQRAIATRTPQVSPSVSPISEEIARRELLAAIRAGGPRNAIVLPIVSHNESLGAIVAMGTSPSPQFSVEDIGVMMEIATRTGLAIVNSRLFTQVERANKEKADFLAVLSHELRTPLTAVIGYAELLSVGVPDPLPETARQHVDRIRSCSWHQLGVVEQIIKYARAESGADETIYSKIDVRTLVNETQEIVSQMPHQKDVLLNIDIPTGSFVLHSDAGKLRQILVNLVTNAFKFTDEGAVSIIVRHNDDNAYFTVADTGIGIAPEEVPRVFDPFWRARKYEDFRRSGMGLGLAVSNKLARSLKGELSVQSQVGVGTMFTLRVPIQPPAVP